METDWAQSPYSDRHSIAARVPKNCHNPYREGVPDDLPSQIVLPSQIGTHSGPGDEDPGTIKYKGPRYMGFGYRHCLRAPIPQIVLRHANSSAGHVWPMTAPPALASPVHMKPLLRWQVFMYMKVSSHHGKHINRELKASQDATERPLLGPILLCA